MVTSRDSRKDEADGAKAEARHTAHDGRLERSCAAAKRAKRPIDAMVKRILIDGFLNESDGFW